MNKPRTPLENSRLNRSLLLLLAPGLAVRRWLLVGGLGLLIIAIGAMLALSVSAGPAIGSLFDRILLGDEPPIVRGAVFLGLGAFGALVAVLGLTFTLSRLSRRPGRRSFLQSLYVERILGSGPRITVIGGGSGLPSLIRGIKHYSHNITAIVTMADDGGSSGRLRNELGIQPPGDIRNCLVALADSEAVMQQLMDHRFSSDGQLDGHSFGNILIAALTEIGGDFYRAVEIAGELLAIRGRVTPSTVADVTLIATTEAGETLVGESNVATASGRLQSLSLSPPCPPAHPEALEALQEADLIIIGPGSLYTSIVPNLLIPGIARAVVESKALKVYICNVAEEPRQTEGFSVQEHLDEVRHYLGEDAVHAVVANSSIPDGPTPAGLDFIRARHPWEDHALLIEADVIDESATARHDSSKLANTVAATYRRHRGKRRRLPWRSLNPSVPRSQPAPIPAEEAPARQ